MALPLISENNFYTAPAEGREARRAMRDRDKRMKLVLGSRQEGHMRHEVREHSIEHLVHGTGWLSEAERLRGDCGDTVRRELKNQKQHKQAVWDRTRSQRQERQAQLQHRRDNIEEHNGQRAADLAGTGRRNMSSVRYNLINHVHSDSRSAALAKYRDDKTKYSAVCRSRELMHKANLCGYNIISGETRPADLVPAMARPQPPSDAT